MFKQFYYFSNMLLIEKFSAAENELSKRFENESFSSSITELGWVEASYLEAAAIKLSSSSTY